MQKHFISSKTLHSMCKWVFIYQMKNNYLKEEKVFVKLWDRTLTFLWRSNGCYWTWSCEYLFFQDGQRTLRRETCTQAQAPKICYRFSSPLVWKNGQPEDGEVIPTKVSTTHLEVDAKCRSSKSEYSIDSSGVLQFSFPWCPLCFKGIMSQASSSASRASARSLVLGSSPTVLPYQPFCYEKSKRSCSSFQEGSFDTRVYLMANQWAAKLIKFYQINSELLPLSGHKVERCFLGEFFLTEMYSFPVSKSKQKQKAPLLSKSSKIILQSSNTCQQC